MRLKEPVLNDGAGGGAGVVVVGRDKNSCPGIATAEYGLYPFPMRLTLILKLKLPNPIYSVSPTKKMVP
jgi:hypothetical protein